MFVIKNLNEVGYSPKNTNIDKPVFHKDALLKSKWTYSTDKIIDGYWSSISLAQKEMIETMTILYKLLDERDISLSIVVYPWPQQLENDIVNSKHAQMWREFCGKMFKFHQSFSIFF